MNSGDGLVNRKAGNGILLIEQWTRVGFTVRNGEQRVSNEENGGQWWMWPSKQSSHECGGDLSQFFILYIFFIYFKYICFNL